MPRSIAVLFPRSLLLASCLLAAVLIAGCEQDGSTTIPPSVNSTTMDTTRIEHLSPPTLFRNPAFSQVVSVSGPAKTVYVGGQDAVDSAGELVGEGDLAAQTEQVLQNVEAALAAGGARIEHVVKWNIYMVAGQDAREGYEVFQRKWGTLKNPPIVTLLYVSALAQPGYLVEVDAVAVVP